METDKVGGIEGYMLEFLRKYNTFLLSVEPYKISEGTPAYQFVDTDISHTEIDTSSAPYYYPFDSKLRILRRGKFEKLLAKEKEFKGIISQLNSQFFLEATPHLTNTNGLISSYAPKLEQNLSAPPYYELFIEGIEFPLNKKQKVLCVLEYSDRDNMNSPVYKPKNEVMVYFNPRPNLPLNKISGYDPRWVRGYENKGGREKGLLFFDLGDDEGYFCFGGEKTLRFGIKLEDRHARLDFSILRFKEPTLGNGALNAFLGMIGDLEVKESESPII